MAQEALQSTALRVPLKAFLASDGISPATGKTIAIVISKNGGAFANPSAGATNATEISNGWYYVDLSTTDTATLGPLLMRGTAGGVSDVEPPPYNVVLATNRGNTALPNAAANTNGGLPVLSSSGTTLAYTLSTLTTYTGNTPQTGDAYARLGAPTGASIAADIQTRSTYAGGAVASVTAPVTVGTNSDKTGYSLTQTFPPNFSALGITVAGKISEVVLVDTLATAPPTSSVIAAAVWDLATSGHTTSGTFGNAMNAAGSAGDPWATSLPGSYGAGTAGYVLGHNVDAQISTRSTFAGGAVASVTAAVTVGTNNDKTGYALTTAPPTSSVIAAAVWDLATSGHTTSGTFGAAMNAAGSAGDPWATSLPGSYGAGTAGYVLGHNVDAQISTRSTYAGGAVASVTAPVTVGTNNDKSGYLLASAGLDAINVESGVNARQALSPILAAAAGVVSGATAGASNVVIKGGNVATTRISATTDAFGNRSVVSLTLPS